MKSKQLIRVIPAAVMLAILSFGCARESAQMAPPAQPAAAVAAAKENVLQGPIIGKSNKAKTVSIEVGSGDKTQAVMLRFDDKTKGLEFAEKGEAAIITWEQRGEDKFATMIKPKLAKLPAGVVEIKVDEVHKLVAADTAMTLVDARPESRYQQAHLPGAINIPVPRLKKMEAAALPADKDKLLIFYCGGPT